MRDLPTDKAQFPFSTSDKKLAAALATAGCAFLPISATPGVEGGPASNVYTPGFLRDRKVIEGQVPITEFEDGVAQLVARRIPGHVTYHFIRDAIFDRAIAAWDALVDEMVKARNENRAPKLPQISEETVMEVLYLHRMNEREFARVPFIKRPECAIGLAMTSEEPLPNHDPDTRKEAHLPVSRTRVKGSMKRWTLGCSQEMRDNLKLDGK